MAVFETDRLVLRRLTVEDAPFILRLLNEPSFLQHIGDRGVRNLADAKQYSLRPRRELRAPRLRPVSRRAEGGRRAHRDLRPAEARRPRRCGPRVRVRARVVVEGIRLRVGVGDARLRPRRPSPEARRGHHVARQRRVNQPAREARLLFRPHGADARRQGRGEAVRPAARRRGCVAS